MGQVPIPPPPMKTHATMTIPLPPDPNVTPMVTYSEFNLNTPWTTILTVGWALITAILFGLFGLPLELFVILGLLWLSFTVGIVTMLILRNRHHEALTYQPNADDNGWLAHWPLPSTPEDHMAMRDVAGYVNALQDSPPPVPADNPGYTEVLR